MEEIEKLKLEYENNSQKVIDRRNEWKNSIKQIILSSLEKIVKKVDLKWFVLKYEDSINHEAIFLTFGQLHSGIIVPKSDSKRVLTKHGGNLSFAQLVNGEIYCWITFPYVEEIQEPIENKFLGVFEPSELTEEIIKNLVREFLHEIVKLDSDQTYQEQREPIGYRYKYPNE